MQETLSTGLKTTLNEKETNKTYNSIMKKISFLNKLNNNQEIILAGKVGERVFPIVNNVKETNDAIRWCNQHKVGDKFECNDYSIEIVEG